MQEGLVKLGAVIAILGGVASLVCFYWAASLYLYGSPDAQTIRDLVRANYGITLGMVVSLMGVGVALWGLAATEREASQAGPAPLDIAVLRGFLRQGGFREDAVPCPGCGAVLLLPDRGVRVRCGTCGTAVSADELLMAFQRSLRPPGPPGETA